MNRLPRRNIGISNEIPAQKEAPHNTQSHSRCRRTTRIHASNSFMLPPNNGLRKRAGREIEGHVVDLEEKETSLTYEGQPREVEQASMVNQWRKWGGEELGDDQISKVGEEEEVRLVGGW